MEKAAAFLSKRIKGYSLIIFLSYIIYFMVAVLFIKDSLVGVDFSVYYTAGKMAVEGHAVSAYNQTIHHNMLQAILGQDLTFPLGWFYPPMYFLALMPLTILPYKSALILWMTISLILYVYGIHKITGQGKFVFLALGFPGVLMTLHWGQNSLISVFLIGMAIYHLDRKPMLAGVMLGLLCYKPQLAFFAWLIILLMREWKVLMWATLTFFLSVLTSIIVVGLEPWVTYMETQITASATLLGDNFTMTAAIQPSLYGAMKVLNFNDNLIKVSQMFLSAMMVATLFWTWTKSQSLGLKGAMLVLTILLANPYFMQYELLLLVLVLIWFVRDCLNYGWLKGDLSMAVLLWLTPLINLPLVHLTHVQIAPIVMILMVITLIRRLRRKHFIG